MKVGQPVEVTLPYLPGKQFEGRVAYIYPALEGTRAPGACASSCPTPSWTLKPDMYADVALRVARGSASQVPEAAVVYTGPRRLVFVDLGEGRLRPQEVTLGVKGEGHFEVVAGLKAGDVVVTSGNFLVAAESRLRSAAEAGGGGEHAAQ